MVKIRLSPGISSISGRQGSGEFKRQRAGVSAYTRHRTIRSLSLHQTAISNRFLELRALWQCLPPLIRATWHPPQEGADTPFGLFLQINWSRNWTDSPPDIVGPTITASFPHNISCSLISQNPPIFRMQITTPFISSFGWFFFLDRNTWIGGLVHNYSNAAKIKDWNVKNTIKRHSFWAVRSNSLFTAVTSTSRYCTDQPIS